MDEKNDIDLEDLDHKGTYKQLSQEKRGYKEQLHSVIISCVTLEFSINDLVEIAVKKLPSPNLEKWANNVNVPISNKLKALRFADIIDEDLYKNLSILFKIRNQFAHKMPLPLKKLKSEFQRLKETYIKSDFVKKLPNDSIKFQLIVSQCFLELLQISKKLDPSSVLELELVGDITQIEE